MIRLIDARLCSDCDNVFDEELFKDCPRCASVYSIHLKRFVPPVETVQGKKSKIDISGTKGEQNEKTDEGSSTSING